MTDTEKELLCPACNKKMKKVFIKDSKMYVDICTDGCGGIFFDNRELEKVDEAHENADEILKEIQNKSFAEADKNIQRTCPVCGTKMMHLGAAKGKVKIDVCSVCGGKFLDAGELEIIRNTPLEEIDNQMQNLLKDMYQDNLNQVTYGLRDVLKRIYKNV